MENNNENEKVVNYDENGKEVVLSSVNNSDSNLRRVIAKISIGYLMFLFLVIIFLSTSIGEGAGMLAIVFFPFFMGAYILYPIYFIFLSIRYLREKNELDSYEKIAFFMLLIGLIIFWVSVFLF